jgi:hypothetical protein
MRAALFATVLVAATSGLARAQDLQSDRHLGVQLRATSGPALIWAFQDVGQGASGNTRGIGAAFDLALGTMIGDAIALNMDLVLVHSADAEHGVLRDTVFSAVHFGGGITYWIMPENLYLAASIGFARSSVEGNPVRVGIEIPTADQSAIGAGAHLAFGKQWWVSRRVGLGATLSALSSVAGTHGSGRDSNRYVLAVVAAFCATLH